MPRGVHTEEIINRLRTVLLFHRKTSKPSGVKTDIGIRSTSNVDTFGGSRLLVKSMFRRTPRQGKCTSTPASVHLSNTTAKRKGNERSLLGEVREVADMNCVDIIGGGFNVAAFREPRKLGRTEDPCGLVFTRAPRRSPDVGIDGELCRLLRVDQHDRKREEHGRLTNMGTLRLHTFLSTHIEVQPTARNGARSV